MGQTPPVGGGATPVGALLDAIATGCAPRFLRSGDSRTVRPVERNDPTAREIAREVAKAAGVTADVVLFPSGSLPVFAAGPDAVVKLYPTPWEHECDLERAALEACAGRLPIPTPKPLHAERRDGCTALVMTRLRGVSLVDPWRTMTREERVAIARAVGEALAALHTIPVDAPGLARPDWVAFERGQRAACATTQRTRGLDERWAAQVDSFLAATPTGDARRALLHTEVMPEHLLVERRGAGWALTGLLDFEPSIVGAPEYEFASIGAFLTGGEGATLRAMLLAYGLSPRDLDPALARRLLAWTLLHRYSNLARYLAMRPPGPGVTTLDALAARWFAFADEPELRSASTQK